VSRKTVRRILAGTRDDVFRSRETTLDHWTERLNAEWDGGCRNGAALWRHLRQAGYGGSLRVVTEWATRRRRATKPGTDEPGAITTVPSSRTIARLLTSERDCTISAAVKVPRRPAPVNTSKRRGTSDIDLSSDIDMDRSLLEPRSSMAATARGT